MIWLQVAMNILQRRNRGVLNEPTPALEVFAPERNMIGAEEETEIVHGKLRPRFSSSKSDQGCDMVLVFSGVSATIPEYYRTSLTSDE